MIIEISFAELQTLWLQEYIRDARAAGWIIIREHTDTFLIEVLDAEQFLNNTPNSLSSEVEKDLLDTIKNNQ